MLLYNLQQIFIIFEIFKFNLKYYSFHGHEKTHDSLLVDRKKSEVVTN
jgi:hypothetical protein